MNSKKKILIVDDEPDVLKYLETLLVDNGFDVIKATSGKECLEKAISEKPDLITLDISMPEESGVRVFADLQKNENTKFIPVIIITGVSIELEKLIKQYKKTNIVVESYEKPIIREKLIESINKILKNV